jgi:hypothetical protein
MQDGTLLKENTKGRNSNFFLNQGCFEFSQFLSQLNDLSFLLHLGVYLGAYICYEMPKQDLLRGLHKAYSKS